MDAPKVPEVKSSVFTLELQHVTSATLDELEAQAAELWLRYRPDQRQMLTAFFHSIVVGAVLRRQNQITHLFVELAPHPTDPVEQIDSDLGTAMARMLALTEDPRTSAPVRDLWLRLAEQVREMRSRIGR